MEFYEELLLSLITILFAILIGKIASAAADLDRDHAEVGRSVELAEIGGKRERSEEAEAVGGIRGESVDDGCGTREVFGSGQIGSNEVGKGGGEIVSVGDEKLVESSSERSKEASADEFNIGAENREDKRSEVDDVILEELAETVKIGKGDAELIKEEGRLVHEDGYDFDLQEEENREEKRSEVDDVISQEDYRKELVETGEIGKGDAELVSEEGRLAEVRSVHEEGYEGGIGRGEKSGIDEKGESLLYGEDEWEGIERTALEKLFRVATEYAGSENGGNALSKLSSDVQKQLYGLHKVATEGPCYKSQPLALKVSARAKWHAWQSLGNMNPEVAMEQYITLLSESIPGWMGENPGGDAKHGKSSDAPDVGVSRTGKRDLSSFLHGQPSSGTQRIFEDPSCIEVDKATSGHKLFEQGLTKTFFFDLLSPTRVTFFSFYW